MGKADRADRMAWSGTCDNCNAVVIIYANPEMLVDEVSNTWPEDHHDCLMPECDGMIEWNGNDPASMVLHERML